jgi:hypothetical protein
VDQQGAIHGNKLKIKVFFGLPEEVRAASQDFKYAVVLPNNQSLVISYVTPFEKLRENRVIRKPEQIIVFDARACRIVNPNVKDTSYVSDDVSAAV